MIQRDRLLDDNESTALDSTETDAQTNTSKTPKHQSHLLNIALVSKGFNIQEDNRADVPTSMIISSILPRVSFR